MEQVNLSSYRGKTQGDPISAELWNALITSIENAINALVTASGGEGGVVTLEQDQNNADKKYIKVNNVVVGELTAKGDKGTNVTLGGNNNINIEPREALGTGEGKNQAGNANRKGGNIALKPGDDIELWAHKRGSSKNDEVSVKVLTEVPKDGDPTDTDEVAAKLQLNAADMVLTSKDKKTGSSEMNITVNKAANTRGYLKVRAQAIDLRCEDHGGIALQPKGEDGEGHMNKIKFEHGGGDGKEFGTFNSEKTSIFTDEYRFKKDGVLKLATRTLVDNTPNAGGNDKYDGNDETTHYGYAKQADDFYDVIDQDDPTCNWEDIVKTAHAFNASPCCKTKITNKHNLEIATAVRYKITVFNSQADYQADPDYDQMVYGINGNLNTSLTAGNGYLEFDASKIYTEEDLITMLGVTDFNTFRTGFIKKDNVEKAFYHVPSAPVSVGSDYTPAENVPYNGYVLFEKVRSAINLESGGNIKLKGSQIDIKDAKAITTEYLYDKSVGTEDHGVLKVIVKNNTASGIIDSDFQITGWDAANDQLQQYTIPRGESQEIASASILDIILLTNYMKANNQGPWEPPV